MAVVVLADRDRVVAAHEARVDQARRRSMSTSELGEVGALDAEALGQHAGELLGRQHAVLDEDAAGQSCRSRARASTAFSTASTVAKPSSTTTWPISRVDRPRVRGAMSPGISGIGSLVITGPGGSVDEGLTGGGTDTPPRSAAALWGSSPWTGVYPPPSAG